MKAEKIFTILIILLLVLIVATTILNLTKGKSEEKVFQESKNEVVEENNMEEFVEVQENGSKVNMSEELKKTKTIDGLEISNISLVENNNVSKIVANVTNSTNKTLGGFLVDIIVKNKDGKEITTIGAYIDKVKSGETVQLNASATSDFVNANDIEIVKK